MSSFVETKALEQLTKSPVEFVEYPFTVLQHTSRVKANPELLMTCKTADKDEWVDWFKDGWVNGWMDRLAHHLRNDQHLDPM